MPAIRSKLGATAAKARSSALSSSSRTSPLPPSPDATQEYTEPGDSENESDAQPSAKRRKISRGSTAVTIGRYRELIAKDVSPGREPCLPPSRQHSLSYHKPLLLDGQFGRENRDAFLSWFDSVSSTRAMPWRKAWIDPRATPESDLRQLLERRAYEVWISEIMLQQTRVAAVIDYWNKWMDKWPTIQDLAKAEPDDVLAAWRGLGYYSRATRIHEAAKAAVADPTMKGLLPSTAAELEKNVAGVGRYTAGAISCIVFGRPAPMVDGNVLRVLSRQLGIYGNIKNDKSVIDMIWAAADALVNAVASDAPDGEQVHETSNRPGRWGQGLMELGSTVCTPKPNCSECPITATCRAYSEGAEYAAKTKAPPIVDMEDACGVCETYEEEESEQPVLQVSKKPAKQMTLSAFAFTKSAPKESSKPAAASKSAHMDKIVDYAKRFPVKVAKKAVREEETLVCAIRRSDGSYLIHRRPEKGLLAGLWEFPSNLLATNNLPASERKQAAIDHVAKLVDGEQANFVASLGTVPWLFSHIKLQMHVYLFSVGDADGPDESDKRWTADVDGESMGTGMRKCWDLVRVRE